VSLKNVLAVALGILSAIGGFVDIGDLATVTRVAGARLGGAYRGGASHDGALTFHNVRELDATLGSSMSTCIAPANDSSLATRIVDQTTPRR